MYAEVIAIGDELVSGQRIDTNSPWLSERLGELGVPVKYHTTLADDLAVNVRAFREAFDRADVVVMTGGLGPTADDLTREAMAEATGSELVLDEAMLEHIQSLFTRRGRTMPERNRVQAMRPAASRPIPNPHGTAPGIVMAVPRAGRSPCHVFAVPGVPAEMYEMWQATVADAVRALLDRPRVIRHRRLKCFGVGESDLEQMLPDLIRRGRTPSVGITVSKATITLRVTASGETPEEAEAAMLPTVETIHQCLGNLVFGQEDEELPNVVARLLSDRGLTLSTAEWGTGGLIAHWLNEAGAAPHSYRGGVIVASPQMLEASLGVPAELGTRREIAIAMAENCRQRFNTDVALSVSEFPALDPNFTTPPKVYFAVALANEVQCAAADYAAHPEILKVRGAKQALNMLRLALLGR